MFCHTLQILIGLYNQTLSVLNRLPGTFSYRNETEKLTKARLQLVEQVIPLLFLYHLLTIIVNRSALKLYSMPCKKRYSKHDDRTQIVSSIFEFHA